ncbi:hypothetical protein SRABI106_03431 [Rahnella aquatilis]|nr:hypothetical protein SRABI106_03431 [Rahnella aquatilis]
MQIRITRHFKQFQAILRKLAEIDLCHLAQGTGEQALRNAFCGRQTFCTMNHTGDFLSQNVLCAWRFTAGFVFFFQRIDVFNAHEGEEFQEAVNVSIRRVDPELVEFVRAGFLRIQPDCATFSFTKFSAVRFGDQRNGQAKHLFLMQTTGQIDT